LPKALLKNISKEFRGGGDSWGRIYFGKIRIADIALYLLVSKKMGQDFRLASHQISAPSFPANTQLAFQQARLEQSSLRKIP
jgi:hypothetical protein